MNTPDTHSIVTGASSGMGFNVAKRLVERDGKGTVHSFDVQHPLHVLDGMVDHLVDIRETPKVVREMQSIKHQIHLLFNNAGVLVRGGLLGVSYEELHKMMTVNALGSWNMIKIALEKDKMAQGATILQMCSTVGGPEGHRMNRPKVGAYAQSKILVHEMGHALKTDLYNIRPDLRFKMIYPGAVETPMTTGGVSSEEDLKAYREQAVANWGVLSTAEEMGERIMALVESNAEVLYWDERKQEYVME